jgi:preprotein translocase subunit YajC
MSPEGGSLLQMVVPLAMVFAIFYFIVIVPNKRQQKA